MERNVKTSIGLILQVFEHPNRSDIKVKEMTVFYVGYVFRGKNVKNNNA
jgi:hypothetical protein